MILMFLFFVLSALFFIFVLPASGQNIAQFKDVPLGKVVDDQRYVDGNKYQKDAMLFMDMLANTHPYYIKADRRNELFSRMDGLLADCAVCEWMPDSWNFCAQQCPRLAISIQM